MTASDAPRDDRPICPGCGERGGATLHPHPGWTERATRRPAPRPRVVASPSESEARLLDGNR